MRTAIRVSYTFAGWSPRLARGRPSGLFGASRGPVRWSLPGRFSRSVGRHAGAVVLGALIARGSASPERLLVRGERRLGSKKLGRLSPREAPLALRCRSQNTSSPFRGRVGVSPARAPGPTRFRARGSTTIATWLILPVVICLSQRLSHACLSMRGLNTLKLRMAHYISNNFFDGPLATRIPVENLELIRARRPDPREGLQLLDTRPTAFGDPR